MAGEKAGTITGKQPQVKCNSIRPAGVFAVSRKQFRHLVSSGFGQGGLLTELTELRRSQNQPFLHNLFGQFG
jgi:hypothetical protein